VTAAIAIAAVLVALAVAHWTVCRLRRAESHCDRLIREAHGRADAAREWDDIALAYNLPAYSGPEPNAALERLRQDITDEHTKGD
jgi:hypothetical protein